MRNQAVTVTVVGWAGNTPKQVVGDGVPFTSFRVSARERRYDSRAQEWVDVRTEWFTVKAFRDLAFNLAASVRSGDPVVVTGRLRTEEWQSKDGPRTGLVIDADAVGHDLSLGRAVFARTIHRSEPEPAGETAARDEDPWATDLAPEPVDEDSADLDPEQVVAQALEA